MDILGWLWWTLIKLLSLIWSFAWFLLGGWVATLVQLLIIVGLFFAWRHGWRRAPVEMLARGRNAARFVWAWARMKEPGWASAPAAAPPAQSATVRVVHRRLPGDVNASTLLTVLMLVGLLVVGGMPPS